MVEMKHKRELIISGVEPQEVISEVSAQLGEEGFISTN